MVFPFTEEIPTLPVSARQVAALPGYAADEVPVFIGHYWLPPDHPKSPVASNVACLDYSVAGGGPLVAYRWHGPGSLRAEAFVTSE